MITRDQLASGARLARLRQQEVADFPIRSDEEIEALLELTWRQRPPDMDIWIFGYGSLMWNPAFLYTEQRTGILHGWHRRFCLNLTRGRGTPEAPGIMLALDRGGACSGIAYRLDTTQAKNELLLIWRREMLSGSYLARWVRIATPTGQIFAIAFVVDRLHQRYLGKIPDSEIVERILRGKGDLGTCLQYFVQAESAIQTLGLRDGTMVRLARILHATAGSRLPKRMMMAPQK